MKNKKANKYFSAGLFILMLGNILRLVINQDNNIWLKLLTIILVIISVILMVTSIRMNKTDSKALRKDDK